MPSAKESDVIKNSTRITYKELNIIKENAVRIITSRVPEHSNQKNSNAHFVYQML